MDAAAGGAWTAAASVPARWLRASEVSLAARWRPTCPLYGGSPAAPRRRAHRAVGSHRALFLAPCCWTTWLKRMALRPRARTWRWRERAAVVAEVPVGRGRAQARRGEHLHAERTGAGGSGSRGTFGVERARISIAASPPALAASAPVRRAMCWPTRRHARCPNVSVSSSSWGSASSTSSSASSSTSGADASAPPPPPPPPPPSGRASGRGDLVMGDPHGEVIAPSAEREVEAAAPLPLRVEAPSALREDGAGGAADGANASALAPSPPAPSPPPAAPLVPSAPRWAATARGRAAVNKSACSRRSRLRAVSSSCCA